MLRTFRPKSVAPGSCVVVTATPRSVSHSASLRACVDLPEPSPPSKAMSMPPWDSRRCVVVSPRSALTRSGTTGTPRRSSICR